MEKILVCDDNVLKPSVSEALKHDFGYKVQQVSRGQEVIASLREVRNPAPDLIILNLSLLSDKAMATIRAIRSLKPDTPVIVLTAYGDEHSPNNALMAGATDFLVKPVPISRLRHSLNMVFKIKRMANYLSWLERAVSGHADFSDIVGSSTSIKASLHLAQQAAASRSPVWLEGEEGTGKELFARVIHGASSRAGKPFVVVNCDMLSPTVLETMLFGRDQTLADADGFVLGKMREAEHGTLLLKNIGVLPSSLQQKLETYLDIGMIEPFGAKHKMIIDVRIICSSTKPAHFSEKFAKQLKAHKILLPTLDQRKQDIVQFIDHFIAIYSAAEQKYVRGITPEAKHYLLAQSWPGNVGQLSRVIRRAVIIATGENIAVDDLQPALHTGDAQKVAGAPSGKVKTLRSVQEEAIRFALQYSDGCMTRAAKSLGIGRSTLYRKIDEYRISHHISRANQTTRPTMNVSGADFS